MPVHNNKQIDDILFQKFPNIIRIEDYINNYTKIKFKCTIDGYEWYLCPVEITRKNCIKGCPKCINKIPMTNLSFDEKIKNEPFIRISEIVNSRGKVTLKCNKDDHEWTTTIGSILYGKSKCPKCKNKIPLTNEDIDSRLIEKNYNIIRLGDIKNTITKMLWKCSLDGYEWEATAGNILSGHGCKRCINKENVTNDIIDLFIKDKPFIRIGNFTNSHSPISWKCSKLDCGYEWVTVFSSIKRGSGCPSCSRRLPITNQLIDKRLADIPIERLEDVKKAKHKIKWKCSIDSCGFIWETSPDNITTKRTGCPACKKKNEKRILDYLVKEFNNIKTQYRINYNNRKYFIDFVINNNIFIEYNGKQHYEPISYFGGYESFLKQQRRDNEVKEYCKLNNIQLLEIPYYISHDEQYEMIRECLIKHSPSNYNQILPEAISIAI